VDNIHPAGFYVQEIDLVSTVYEAGSYSQYSRGLGMALATHPHKVPRLEKEYSCTSNPPLMYVARSGVNFNCARCWGQHRLKHVTPLTLYETQQGNFHIPSPNNSGHRAIADEKARDKDSTVALHRG
jgi:hypothetical protein